MNKVKNKKRLAAVVTLIALFVFSSAMTVITAAQEASLVSATLTTDKESYNEGEDVDIALGVTNGNIYEINKVKSVISLPAGLTLKDGSLTNGEYSLAAGESNTQTLTAYIETTPAPPVTTPEETPAPVTTPEETPAPVTTPEETPAPVTTPEETPAPVTTPEETPAPVTTPEETPAPVTTPEETPAPVTTPEETPAPVTTPEETPAPVTTPEETPAPVTTPEETPAPVTTPEETTTPTTTVPETPTPDTPVSPDNDSNPPTGGTLCPLWMALAIASGSVLTVLGIKKKHGKKILSLFLCAVLSLTALPVDVFAEEAVLPTTSGSVTASKDITVNGVKKTITAEVTYNENKPVESEDVTVTFDTGDGTPVDPITLKKGETISRLPESFGVGKSFMGWFTDTSFTTEFFTDTPVNEDITLYASFIDSIDNFNSAETTTYYVEDCAENYPITLICDEEITADNVWQYITLFAYTGDTPENYVVSSNGENEYTLVPETPYSKGCMYLMTVNEGVTFKGLDDTVDEYTFKIFKEESNIVELHDGIKYLDKTKLTATENINEYIVSADYFEANSLAIDDVICIDNGTKNISDDCLFVKITNTTKIEDSYYIQTVDCEVEDVFEKVDIYFSEPAHNKYLEDDLDTEALEQEILNSEGVQQLNLVLAAVLAESEAVNEIMEGEPLVTDAFTASDDDRMKDFSDYASMKGDTLLDLSKKLGQSLTVKVTIGEAVNNNFTIPNPDYWTAITFTLGYKSKIKNKLLVDASFTITEYLNVTLQGYKEFEFKWFELPELEFNYAANIYTQTDIELKVLVCSVGASSYRNITDEVAKMLGSDKPNDTAGLVKDVRDMLDKKGGYIELCRIPFFSTFKPLSLFQLNFDLSFVVKMSFAGGIGSKFSVLDSTQVGAYGNSKDHEFSMYKHKLLEGKRYSFDLTVFGYTGIKMGVSGQLTVSFTGLRRLGEVGVEVQVGLYLDIYGLAKYHVVKPDHRYDTVYRTLMGGFYLEGGIYVEVNLVAESKVFRLRVEAPLIPEIKWPLFSMGDKDLVICLNEQTTPIVFSSSGTYWGEVNIKNLPAVSAQTLDITTGVINNNASVSWDRLSLSVSGNGFRMLYDSRGTFIRYEQSYSGSGFYKNSTAECVGQVHYLGTSLQFTKTADPEMSLSKSVKIIWYDETRVNEEDIGKIFTVNFYREVDGVKTLVETRKVPAGSLAGSYDTDNAPDSWQYIDCNWVEGDPYFIAVDHDNYEIVYTATRAQTLMDMEYYDTVNKEWVVEVWAVNAGDVLKAPENAENEYMKIGSWHARYGIPYGFEKSYTYAGDKLRAIDSDCRKHFYLSGQPTDQPLYKVTGDTETSASANFRVNHYNDYAKAALHFSANYDRTPMNVTFNYYNYAGDMISETVKVPYGTRPGFVMSSFPFAKKFMGYSPDGGKTVYDANTVYSEQLPYVYEDTVYDAVYEAGKFNIEIQYYDDVAREFKTYKTLVIEGGSKVPQSVFDEAWSACNWQEGTTIQFFDWSDVYLSDEYGDSYLNEFIPNKTLIYKDLVIRPRFRRNVTIKLDAGDGRLIFEESKEFKSYSQDNYEIEISRWATKDSDAYNDYQPTGWKDSTTGEIYAIGQTVKLDYSTTLIAQYDVTPKTYTVNVSTPYGVLLNGEKTDTFSGGYDDYLAFVEKYNSFTPADVEGEGYTLKFRSSSSKASDDGLTLDIVYGSWDKVVHKHTLKLDANGGILTGSDESTEDYGTQIKLSDMATVSKTDDLRDYIFSGWKDEDGNIYGADDTITLTKDMALTAVWTDGAYKEYKITFILDSKTIKEVTYHYGDALPTFGAPEEADGYIFNGWSWFGAEGALSVQPDTMPASTLTAIGSTTKCYISYEFDGKTYGTKEVGKIGDTITLIAKPEKDYYDVTDWSADGITITDGKFVMPAHDVTFKATSSPKFYNVNMTIDGSISSDSPISAQYMSVVTLPVPPKKSGYTYYWQSDDVTIYEEDGEYKFDMPHNDVNVECVYTTATHNVYYMIDGETEPYHTIRDVPVGKQMSLYDVGDLPSKDGYLFNEIWVCLTDVMLTDKEDNYMMPDSDVYFWGRYAKDDDSVIALGIEVVVDDQPEKYYTLYVNKGETVTLPDIKHEGYTLSYESDTLTVIDGKVTIPTGEDVYDVNLIAKFTKS